MYIVRNRLKDRPTKYIIRFPLKNANIALLLQFVMCQAVFFTTYYHGEANCILPSSSCTTKWAFLLLLLLHQLLVITVVYCCMYCCGYEINHYFSLTFSRHIIRITSFKYNYGFQFKFFLHSHHLTDAFFNFTIFTAVSWRDVISLTFY